MTYSYGGATRATFMVIGLMVMTIQSSSALTKDPKDWVNMTRSIPQTDNAGSVSATMKMALIATAGLATAAAYVVPPFYTAGWFVGVPLLEEMCKTAHHHFEICSSTILSKLRLLRCSLCTLLCTLAGSSTSLRHSQC